MGSSEEKIYISNVNNSDMETLNKIVKHCFLACVHHFSFCKCFIFDFI